VVRRLRCLVEEVDEGCAASTGLARLYGRKSAGLEHGGEADEWESAGLDHGGVADGRESAVLVN
jgi:hypothetical protein